MKYDINLAHRSDIRQDHKYKDNLIIIKPAGQKAPKLRAKIGQFVQMAASSGGSAFAFFPHKALEQNFSAK